MRQAYVPLTKKEWLAHLLLSNSSGKGNGKGLGGIFKIPYSSLQTIRQGEQADKDLQSQDGGGFGVRSSTPPKSIKAIKKRKAVISKRKRKPKRKPEHFFW